MDNKKKERLFLGSFFITGIFMFAFMGFVLVESSYSNYGLDQKPFYSITAAKDHVELSILGRSAFIPTALWEYPLSFAAKNEYLFIPRTLRLTAQTLLLLASGQ